MTRNIFEPVHFTKLCPIFVSLIQVLARYMKTRDQSCTLDWMINLKFKYWKLSKVHSSLLDINGSFDVNKMNTHQTCQWIYFLHNIFFRFLYKKMDPLTFSLICIKFLSKLERTLVLLRYFKWLTFLEIQ